MQADTLRGLDVASQLPWATLVVPVLAALVPIIQATLTVPLLQVVKHTNAWVGSRSPRVKQALVYVINASLSTGAALLGLTLPALDQWTSATVTSVLGGTLSLVLHSADKTRRLSRVVLDTAALSMHTAEDVIALETQAVRAPAKVDP